MSVESHMVTGFQKSCVPGGSDDKFLNAHKIFHRFFFQIKPENLLQTKIKLSTKYVECRI